ncbi:MAG TPA: hypothetical protein VFC63_16330 [Blastocatellia bacterium]|nr:hypothetical protein [Blastocatellia bacterium]
MSSQSGAKSKKKKEDTGSVNSEQAVVQRHSADGIRKILDGVSNRLKLTALVVLVVEALLLAELYHSSDKTERIVILAGGLGILLIVVVLAFFEGAQEAKQNARATAEALKQRDQAIKEKDEALRQKADSELNQRKAIDQAVKEATKANEAVTRETLQSVGEQLIQRYGIRSESLEMIAEIQNKSGDGNVTRRCNRVQVSAGSPFSYLPGRVWVAGRGKIAEKPKLMEAKFGNDTTAKDVDIKIVGSGKDYCDYKIIIAGQLTYDDGDLSYSTFTKLERMIVMSKAEFDEVYNDPGFPYEYITLEPELPSKALILKVSFPDGYSVKAYPGVFYGDSDTLHNVELGRVKTGFSQNGYSYIFRVAEPLIGFRYCIYWSPPNHAAVS